MPCDLDFRWDVTSEEVYGPEMTLQEMYAEVYDMLDDPEEDEDGGEDQ